MFNPNFKYKKDFQTDTLENFFNATLIFLEGSYFKAVCCQLDSKKEVTAQPGPSAVKSQQARLWII